jgi:hypothetical protein
LHLFSSSFFHSLSTKIQHSVHVRETAAENSGLRTKFWSLCDERRTVVDHHSELLLLKRIQE